MKSNVCLNRYEMNATAKQEHGMRQNCTKYRKKAIIKQSEKKNIQKKKE